MAQGDKEKIKKESDIDNTIIEENEEKVADNFSADSNNQINNEKDEIKVEDKVEVKTEVKTETKSEDKEETDKETKEKIKEEVKDVPKEEIKKEIKEEPKQETKEEVKEETKKEEVKKENNNTPKQNIAYDNMIKEASLRMAKEFEILNNVKISSYEADSVDYINNKKEYDEKLKKISPENRKQAFLNEFRNNSYQFFKEGMNDLIESKKTNGKQTSFVEGTMARDAYMRKMFEFYKLGNPDLEGLEYPQFGGVRAADIKSMQLKAYSSLPPSNKNQKEIKQINDYYAKNIINQRKLESNTFANFINYFNKREGLNFNGKGIENYFQIKWNKLGNKPLAEKQDLFQQEIRLFSERAFERMNKSSNPTDYAKQMEDFDRLTTGIQELCKSKGFMDANKPNKYLAGMTPYQIKSIQLAGLSKKPTTIQSHALENIQDITGFKPSENDSYKQKFGDKYSDLATSPRIKNFNKYVNEIMSKVPSCDDKTGGANNRYFIEAAKTIYGLEQINNSRSKSWKFFHRQEHKAYTEAVNKMMENLKNKNYTKNDVIEQGKAKLSAANDAILNSYQKQKEQINNLYFVVSNKQNQRQNEIINAELNNDREKISVEEANNTKELLNPKETSPFINAPDLSKTINNIQINANK